MTEAVLSPPANQPRAGVVSYLLMLYMGLAWGLMISLQKVAIVDGAHPIGVGFWIVGTSGAVLTVVTLATNPPRGVRMDVVRFCTICGTVGSAFPSVALAWAAANIPAGIVSIAFASMPMFTYALTVMFRVEPAERKRLAGVCIGLIGMLFILLPDQALPSPDMAPWVVLTLIASLGMSVENFYAGGYRPPGVTSLQLSCGRNVAAAVVLGPVVLLTGTAIPLFETWGTMQYAVTGAGLLTASAFTALLYVIKTSGPIFGSQASYLITLFGVGWGMLLFGERHSGYVWAALALIVVGLALVQPRAPKSRLKR